MPAFAFSVLIFSRNFLKTAIEASKHGKFVCPLLISPMTIFSVGTLLFTSNYSTFVGSNGTHTLPIKRERLMRDMMAYQS